MGRLTWASFWFAAAACGGEAHFRPPAIDAGGDDQVDAEVPGQDGGHDAAVDAAPALDAGVDSGCHDDLDQDGFDSPDCGGRDCNDADPTIRPRADDPGEWLFERADELGWAIAPSVAAGADGVPLIAFQDRTAHAVVLATRTSTEEWARVIIEDGGQSPSAALDADGALHVVFVAAADDPPVLRHAVRDGDAWQIETPVAGAADHAPSHPALAAADGTLVVAYADEAPGGAAVMVATRDDAGVWETEDVATELTDGAVALALDADGAPVVAWALAGAVRLAERDGDDWIVELVPAPAGGSPSLAIAPSGEPVLGALDPATRSFVIGRRAEGAWSFSTVDDRHGSGERSAVRVDASGVVHAVYHAPDRFDTRWATDAYGGWLVVTLDRSSETDVSMTIDPNGAIHTAYGTSDSDLHWTRHVMGDGIDQDCDGMIDGG